MTMYDKLVAAAQGSIIEPENVTSAEQAKDAVDAILDILSHPSDEMCRAGSQSDTPADEPAFERPSQIFVAMIAAIRPPESK